MYKTMDFSNSANVTLTDSINDSYATADEDNESQYLSVLEASPVLDTSSGIGLDVQLTLNNSKMEILDNDSDNTELLQDTISNGTDAIAESQSFVFTIDGSEEVYGLQLAQDEHGNLQKFQFQYSKNDDGELVPMLDTIQILPLDDESQSEVLINEADETAVGDELEDTFTELHVSEITNNEAEAEHGLEIVDYEENVCEEEENCVPDFNENSSDVIDTKAGIIEDSYHLMNTNIKQELSADENSQYESENECEEYTNLENQERYIVTQKHQSQFEENVNIKRIQHNLDSEDAERFAHVETDEHISQGSYEEVPVTENGDQYVEAEFEEENMEDEVNADSNEHYEELFVQESHMLGTNGAEDDEDSEDSDNEVYHIVDGIHVTGEVDTEETLYDNQSHSILRETLEHHTKMNILKKPMSTNVISEKSYVSPKIYYVLRKPEKENVNSLEIEQIIQPVKPNPRSILKSSHMTAIVKETDPEPVDKISKRFFRSKEAVQARQFLNFINSTTVPQAPVRKERLPRKQQIKPVERLNEDIVVQEVMVSSKGFVEPLTEDGKKELPITDYVNLTDSDDEYNPNRVDVRRKKYRKNKSNVEITISDSDDSNASLVEIDLTGGESERGKKGNSEVKESGASKRRRGRPPKNRKFQLDSENLNTVSSSESPLKKSRTETENESDSATKVDMKCPQCTETFLTENSLKTHLGHHNLQKGLKDLHTISNKISYKHTCEACGNNFKNSFLLSRHKCDNKTKPKFTCNICKKGFSELFTFNLHKKSHAKEQLMKTTEATTISPKKIKSRVSVLKPPRTSKAIMKCDICSKVCSSKDILDTHQKTHKQFSCASCSQTFNSKLLLNLHVTKHCVKVKSASNRRLSFKIRKSFVNSPTLSRKVLNRRRVTLSDNVQSEISRLPTRIQPVVTPSRRVEEETHVTPDMTRASGIPYGHLQCDKCPMKFSMHAKLFNHKVIKHGLETPDKSIMESTGQKRNASKQTVTHGGIPASRKMANVYAALKNKLQGP